MPPTRQHADRLGRPDDAARITAIRETIEESAVLAGLRANTGGIDPALGPVLQDALLGGSRLRRVARPACACARSRRADRLSRAGCPRSSRRAASTRCSSSPRPCPATGRRIRNPANASRPNGPARRPCSARIDAGSDHAIFPTKRNLERLARFASIDEARADAALHSLDTIIPWVEERDGEPHVCLPAGRGYPVTSEPLATAFRA